MEQAVMQFMKDLALLEGFKVYDFMYGHINLDDSEDTLGAMSTIDQSSGSVYGIFATPDSSELPNNFFDFTKTLEMKSEFPIFPVYWGIDTNPGSRILKHVRPAGNTGNAELEMIEDLRAYKLFFVNIYVSDYHGFEKLLYERYQPPRGSSRRGKLPIYVNMIN